MKQFHYMIHKCGVSFTRTALATLLITACLLSSVASSFLPVTASAKSPALVILNRYSQTLDIGNEFYLVAVASNGNMPSFKSSKSSVASVNTYGLVTAKSAGTCKITAKVSGGEASCKVTVRKTAITLNRSSLSLERGSSFLLKAKTSNGSLATFRSSKKSVAEVDENGKITAMKPGSTTVTVRADKTSVKCSVTVKSPTVQLNRTSATLLRGQQLQLSAIVSSGIAPTWKSNRNSVATVDETGKVTACRHGTATIRATVDGVTKTCEITVKSPVIKLSQTTLSLQAGKTTTLTATVSSGNQPLWKSSRNSVATVSQNGKITARKTGSTVISVSEDGTTATCHVQVVSPKK